MLLFCILILPLTAVHADKSMAYTINLGSSFTWPGPGHSNPKNKMVGVGLRKYFNNNLYILGKVSNWDSGKQNFKGGTVIVIGVGGKTSGKYFVDGSLGIGYLDNPDGKKVEDG